MARGVEPLVVDDRGGALAHAERDHLRRHRSRAPFADVVDTQRREVLLGQAGDRRRGPFGEMTAHLLQRPAGVPARCLARRADPPRGAVVAHGTWTRATSLKAA